MGWIFNSCANDVLNQFCHVIYFLQQDAASHNKIKKNITFIFNFVRIHRWLIPTSSGTMKKLFVKVIKKYSVTKLQDTQKVLCAINGIQTSHKKEISNQLYWWKKYILIYHDFFVFWDSYHYIKIRLWYTMKYKWFQIFNKKLLSNT